MHKFSTGCELPPALLRKLPMNMLAVFYTITADKFFLDLLWQQASIDRDGLFEHTRIDK